MSNGAKFIPTLSVYPTCYCMSIPMALVLLMGIVKTGVKFI